MPAERLQKILAAAGVASRRASEELIAAGRVQVDGKTITELGTKVDPDQVEIRVDGKPITRQKRNVYIKLHKPREMLSDIGGNARGRTTVADLLPPEVGRVFPVGRLDYKSEGLMLLTDDGPLAHRLTHPRYEHPKTYYVLVAQQPSQQALRRLRTGVEIETGRTSPAQVDVVPGLPKDLVLEQGVQRGVWLRFVLREGKKRQIRHMVAEVELPLLRLVRWAIGPLTLANLPPRAAQHLTGKELAGLRQMVRAGRRAQPNPVRGRPRRR